MTPIEFCRASLSALDAAEGRTRKRKRDQTPDAIGLALKRALLERGVQEDPAAEDFEAWLARHADNPMARPLLDDWRLAQAVPEFAAWLDRGAPSDDADHTARAPCRDRA
jgi:hypothetical protein